MLKRFVNANNWVMRKTAQRGQVAIMMIFIIAVALIIFAIATNVGKISDTRTKITIAADSGAAYMASGIASYGQSLFKTQLGGRRKKCSSGFLITILMAVLIIVIAVITIVSGGAGIVLFAAVVAIVAAVVSIALQVMVVQPGITNSWNKIMDATLSQTDQFLERGIQTALQKAVQDMVQVRDFYDDDQDTLYDSIKDNTEVDKISRFAHYYGKRINGIKAPDREDLYSFLNKLRCLVYGQGFCDENDTPGEIWALTDLSITQGNVLNSDCYFDPARPEDPIPSYCNVCCVPEFVYDSVNPEDEPVRFRPECCDAEGASKCGNVNLCEIYSPYGKEYPFVYDPTYEFHGNNVVSFREKLGYDDENIHYTRKLANVEDPLDMTMVGEVSNIVQNYSLVTGEEDFEAWDATGFPAEDALGGVFSLLQKSKQFYMNLNDLDGEVIDRPEKGACFWVANNQRNPSVACDDFDYWNYSHRLFRPPETSDFLYSGFTLPIYPKYVEDNEILPESIVYGPRIETATYVNNGRIGATYADIDHVVFPKSIDADPEECAQDAIEGDVADEDTIVGIWKSGADRYCSTGGTGDKYYPYHENCDKHRPDPPCTEDDLEGGEIVVDCICTDGQVTDKSLFNEDLVDEVVYGLKDFVWYVDRLLENQDSDLAIALDSWYDEAARWFEPAEGQGACFNCNNIDNHENPIDGGLHRIHKNIRITLDRLVAWRDQSFLADDAWCMPTDQNKLSGDIIFADSEINTFDANGNTINGDMEDIVACLEWNATHSLGATNDDEGKLFQPLAQEYVAENTLDTALLPVDMTDKVVAGNASKFEFCAQTCSQEACGNLPRSLVPHDTWTPQSYSASGSDREDELRNLLACFYDCNACAGVTFTVPVVDAEGNPVVDGDGNPVTTPSCAVPLKNVIIDEIETINPICAPDENQAVGQGGQNEWIDYIRQSAFEAALQTPKLARRAQYLKDIWTELNEKIDFLYDAERKLDSFLNGRYRDQDTNPDAIADQISGGANDLVAARQKLAGIDDGEEASLPYYVVYAWQDEAKEGQRAEDARWHFVRVDGRVPGRCDNACWPDQDKRDGPRLLPRVRTYTKGFLGSTRCYELDREDGVVKIRVTRYDGPRFEPDGARSILRFPNGIPIWQFRGQQDDARNADDKPRMEPGSAETFIKSLGVGNPLDDIACVNYITKGPDIDPDAYKGAFMINYPVLRGDSDFDQNSAECWIRVNQLLSLGSVAERCAKYYYHEGTTKGFTFQFIECDEF